MYITWILRKNTCLPCVLMDNSPSLNPHIEANNRAASKYASTVIMSQVKVKHPNPPYTQYCVARVLLFTYKWINFISKWRVSFVSFWVVINQPVMVCGVPSNNINKTSRISQHSTPCLVLINLLALKRLYMYLLCVPDRPAEYNQGLIANHHCNRPKRTQHLWVYDNEERMLYTKHNLLITVSCYHSIKDACERIHIAHTDRTTSVPV